MFTRKNLLLSVVALAVALGGGTAAAAPDIPTAPDHLAHEYVNDHHAAQQTWDTPFDYLSNRRAVAARASRAGERTAAPDTYKVKRGDTLAELAEKHDIKGGHIALWGANLKKIDHPDILVTGTKIVLDSAPKKGKKAYAKLPPPPAPVVTTTTAPTAGASTAPSYSSGRCGGDLPSCAIMYCESGGNIHAENPTSTASGKWQIIDGTWNGYGGYSHASDAPEHVQDAKARELWAGGAGRSHWVC